MLAEGQCLVMLNHSHFKTASSKQREADRITFPYALSLLSIAQLQNAVSHSQSYGKSAWYVQTLQQHTCDAAVSEVQVEQALEGSRSGPFSWQGALNIAAAQFQASE